MQLLVAVGCVVDEEQLWQALAARFPDAAAAVTGGADVWIDPRKRRWEFVDADVTQRRHVIGQTFVS